MSNRPTDLALEETDVTATTARPTRPPSPLTTGDQVRRLVVVAAEVFCVVGTLVGVGVLGTRVEESSGGALAATATLVAPAGPAFSIWTPIYLGLLGYAVWQLLPAHAVRDRARSTGWLAAASMVLNALWLLVTQQGSIWASVVVIVALALTLGVLVPRLGGRWAVTAAMAWGLAWIAIGRLGDEPRSVATGIAAAVAAVVVLVAAQRRHRRQELHGH
ncbi:TspO/MBR family protein [Terrabacter sp. NPDC080008]|uniref:TspO/MBR family protein n=1 Tax=Terrabacter sp. NPDC080008 TaxID=3155176 RepID=UPI00344DF8FA